MARFVDKEKKAEQIASAAIEVFGDIGYHKTRMEDIAHAAGVGKGTIYEYFNNKADILRFEFEQFFSAFKSGAIESMAEAASDDLRLLALVDFTFDHAAAWEDHCAVYMDYFGTAQARRGEGFSLSNIYAEIQNTIRILIEDGQSSGVIDGEVDPGAMAELLVSVFDGVVMHAVFAEAGRDADSLRLAAKQLITRGLLSS